MTLAIGFAGCGFIASIHSLALKMLVDAGLVEARVTATHDRDPARATRLAAGHGAAVHDDLDSLLDAVDVVWVCTWTSDHLEVVDAAARHGVAVWCEKPLAPTLEECVEVARLLDGVPHQVGLVLRHSPVFVAAAEAIASGEHGRPLAALLRDDQYFPVQGQYGSDWRADVARAGGGTLLEHSIHDVDLLRWLLGEPTDVSAHVASRFGHPGIDDVADATLRFGDGTVATLVSVWHQILRRPSTRRLEVFCEDALLWADDDHLGPLHIERSDDVTEVACAAPRWSDSIDLAPEIALPLLQYAVPAKAFLDAVAAGRRPFPDAATALAAHRIVAAAYRSARAGGAPVGLSETS
jgi:myo-inositol 2-dehydrogenase / D-chiro-inositol 1-dehydrogenase